MLEQYSLSRSKTDKFATVDKSDVVTYADSIENNAFLCSELKSLGQVLFI